MTILVLADFLSLGGPGGLGRAAWESSKALAELGHRPVVVEPRRHTTPVPDTIDGVVAFRHGQVRPLRLGEFLAPPTDLVRRVASRFAPQATIVHGPLSAWTARRWPGAGRPRVLVYYSPWGDECRVDSPGLGGRLGGRLREMVERRLVHWFDAHVTLSAYMADRLTELHRIPRRVISVLPGGVNLRQFTPGDGQGPARRRLGWPPAVPTLVTVRNLRRRMGLSGLLEAMVRVRERLGEVRLVIVGRGPLQAPLRARSEELGLAGTVEFAGWVDDECLPDVYRAADLAVVPTAALEGFGLVLLEALACGTPVVATPVGAMPEVLRALDPGLLSPSGSPEDLARTLLAWLVDRHRRQALAARCRPYVERGFTWRRFAGGLVEVARRAAAPRG